MKGTGKKAGKLCFQRNRINGIVGTGIMNRSS